MATAAFVDVDRGNRPAPGIAVVPVVVGARGHSALRRFLGSVSSRVVAEAGCSVTVVRPPRENGLTAAD